MKLEELLNKKVIFITGKGGVGKSTTSSAIAYKLANEGNKVLIVDADPAHSLPDTFGITSKVYGDSKGFSGNNKLVKVYKDLDLDLLLLNPITSRKNFEGSHKIMWLAELGKKLGFYSNLSRMSEFFTLAHTLYNSFRKYDKIVIDNEPSAGTLDMIENIDGWINGLDNVNKYKMIFSLILSGGVIDKELTKEVKSIIYGQNGAIVDDYKKMLSSIKKLFTDKLILEPIIIASPEDAVIRETHRLRKELEERLNIPNKYVIFNKVITDGEVYEHQKTKIEEFQKEAGIKYLTIPYLDPKKVNLNDEKNASLVLEEIARSIKDS